MVSNSSPSPSPGERGLKPALDLIQGRGGFHWEILARRFRMRIHPALSFRARPRIQSPTSLANSLGFSGFPRTCWSSESWKHEAAGTEKESQCLQETLTVQIKFHKLTRTTPAVRAGFQRSPLPVSVLAWQSGATLTTIRKSRCRSNCEGCSPPYLNLSPTRVRHRKTIRGSFRVTRSPAMMK